MVLGLLAVLHATDKVVCSIEKDCKHLDRQDIDAKPQLPNIAVTREVVYNIKKKYFYLVFILHL